MSIAREIKRRRLALGLKQAELAERCGITPGAMNRIERGKVPAVKQIDAILAELGLTMRALDEAESGSIDTAIRESQGRGLGVVLEVTPDGDAKAQVRRGERFHVAETTARDVGAELVRLVGVAGR